MTILVIALQHLVEFTRDMAVSMNTGTPVWHGVPEQSEQDVVAK